MYPSSEIEFLSLEGLSARWREILKDNPELGPLKIANEVIAVSGAWHTSGYREQADGRTFRSWLREALGNHMMGQDYFLRRVKALRVLGQDVQSYVHHNTAVWLTSGSVWHTDVQLRAILRALSEKFDETGKPLSHSAGKALVNSIVGTSPTQLAIAKNRLLDGQNALLHERVRQLEDALREVRPLHPLLQE